MEIILEKYLDTNFTIVQDDLLTRNGSLIHALKIVNELVDTFSITFGVAKNAVLYWATKNDVSSEHLSYMFNGSIVKFPEQSNIPNLTLNYFINITQEIEYDDINLMGVSRVVPTRYETINVDLKLEANKDNFALYFKLMENNFAQNDVVVNAERFKVDIETVRGELLHLHKLEGCFITSISCSSEGEVLISIRSDYCITEYY